MLGGRRSRRGVLTVLVFGLSACPQDGSPLPTTAAPLETTEPPPATDSTSSQPTGTSTDAAETTEAVTTSSTTGTSSPASDSDPPDTSSTTMGCVPESDTALCEAASAECGTIVAMDACGEPREAECGGCPSQQSCQQNNCGPALECVAAALPECCESERSALNACAMGACGVFWSAECLALNCVPELTGYSDCVAYDCDSVAGCGASCEAFCAQALDCDPGPTWAECLAACEASDEPLQIGCGIGLECSYNGACTQLPASICPEGQWRCQDIQQCVPEAALCDGHGDCLDDTDEVAGGCASMDCGADAKLCAGACAACPVGAGVLAYACDGAACVVGACEPGYLACDTGCCKEQQVTVENDNGTTVRVHVGTDGAVHLTYVIFNEGLRYARGSVDGKTWSGHRTLWNDDGPNDASGATHLATDAAGKVYVAFRPQGGPPWQLVTDKSGTWVTQPCPPLTADMLGLSIRPDQRPHAWMVFGELWRRDDDATQWTQLTPAPSLGGCSTSAVADGQIHVVCTSADTKSLLHHVYVPGMWTTATVALAAPFDEVHAVSLAADKAGGLHLVYRQSGGQTYLTRYARFVDGAWGSDELLWDAGVGARVAAYEPERPYVALKYDSDWYLASRGAGGWNIDPIASFGPEIEIGALHSGNPILCAASYSDVIACRTAG